jgi:hypothetical protein
MPHYSCSIKPFSNYTLWPVHHHHHHHHHHHRFRRIDRPTTQGNAEIRSHSGSAIFTQFQSAKFQKSFFISTSAIVDLEALDSASWKVQHFAYGK